MMPHTELITLKNVSMRRDERTVLSDINFTLNRGDFLAITGPNGGGKTTLLRIMLKLIRPTEGSVTYFSADGSPTNRLNVGYLPQKNAIDSHFPITVADVVEQGLLALKGISAAERRARTQKMIETVGLTEYASNGLGQLSGGQLQRALLGRALVSEPEVLILDEPLSYIDKHFEQRIYDIVAEVAKTATVVLVSHEISAIAAIATRHLIVDRTLHFCRSHNHFVHYGCEE